MRYSDTRGQVMCSPVAHCKAIVGTLAFILEWGAKGRIQIDDLTYNLMGSL